MCQLSRVAPRLYLSTNQYEVAAQADCVAESVAECQ
jgi:hypothetical protein